MKDEFDQPKDDAPGSWKSPYGPATPAEGHADGHVDVVPPAAAAAAASAVEVPPIMTPEAALPVVAHTPYTADAYPRYQTGAPPPYSSSQQRAPSTALSLMSMIFGIAGLALACCYGAGFLFAIAGVIMGHVSRSKHQGGRGMSTAGLITGYAGIVISMIAIAYLGTNGFGVRRF